MAIVQRSVQVQSDFANANWTKNKLIDALETAFADAGLHGAAVSGIVTGYNDGTTQYGYYINDPAQAQGGGTHGQIANASNPASTSTTNFGNFTFRNLPASGGSGTGATFDVQYNGNVLYRVYVSNGGSGYINGDVLTISSEDILGAANGSANVTVTVRVDPNSYGGSSVFFQKNSTVTSTRPWAVLKVDNDQTKKYGSTYYFIQVVSDTQINIVGGLFWHPDLTRYVGAYRFETWESTSNYYGGPKSDNTTHYNFSYGGGISIKYATTASYPLYIKTYQAAAPQDSNFALFQFAQPDIPGTDHMNDLYYGTFGFPKYTTSIYDNAYVGHIGTFHFENGTSNTNAEFRQFYNTGINGSSTSSWLPRVAEMGWSENNFGGATYKAILRPSMSYWTWQSAKEQDLSTDARLYRRTPADDYFDEGDSDYVSRKEDGVGVLTSLPYQAAGGYVTEPQIDYQSVIKGIPIAPNFLPSPYTIPEDFVVVELEYRQPSAKFLPGDTITVNAGTEAYTIILGGYNNTDSKVTRGVFLCGRIVG